MGAPKINALRAAALPIAAVVIAESWARLTHMQSYTLAPPSQILVAGAGAIIDGSLFKTTWETLVSVVLGFLIGAAVGIPGGIFLGLLNKLDRLFEVPVEFIRAMPSIALLPVWMIIYGLGFKMEIAVIAFTTIWPNLIMARSAVQGITPRLNEVAMVLGLSRLQQIWKIVLPAALPGIFVALRVTLGFSLVVGVTIEIVGNPQGLGSAIMLAREAMNPALMLATLVWIGLLGLLLNIAMASVQKTFFGRFYTKEQEE
ncbi:MULTISPECIES: ABC transporter permease [unclassified Rhizobium]|uniref:ABC transporter permease n=1 Tax=unclassified Rhizobium TaxID=2613769 RepID=UPI001780C6E2|nr:MULTISPECIES: ABC transporter permease subunit [unclassified Rhizobium]MBD8688355.1 ABC transporter permease subunit [Rhizobium sp. CFBP 13644]MBD8692810.1 ABC transporter permease subunit [Rhizobium sp. CFBP 13717]